MGDVDSHELHLELLRFTESCPENLETALDCLNYIHKSGLGIIYPNLSIALRLLLTVPISVASGERNFSKVKLIKNEPKKTKWISNNFNRK